MNDDELDAYEAELDKEELHRMTKRRMLDERIRWLESKMVETLRFCIMLASGIWAALATWIVSVLFETRSPWILVLTALISFGIAAWRLERHVFKSAPIHIRWIDP